MRSLSTSAVALKQVEVFLLEVDNLEDPRTGLLKAALFPAVQQNIAIPLADLACKVFMFKVI